MMTVEPVRKSSAATSVSSYSGAYVTPSRYARNSDVRLTVSSSSSNSQVSTDPRKSCCWEGSYFFDALKAILTRLMFLAHALLAVWRVTLVTHMVYWLFSLSFIGVIVETVVILFKRRGQEWSWFQWSIFLYLCGVIPPIWVLQLNMLGHWNELLNNTQFAQQVNQQTVSGFNVDISTDDWMVVIQQGLLVLLIIGRWIMPKGDLTREQLSGLLLTHLGTASDIVDFMSIISEPNISKHSVFLYAVLACWTWSLMQFPFVVTSTTHADDEEDSDDIKKSNDFFNSNQNQTKSRKRSRLKKHMKVIRNFFETEAWGIFVSVLMQDGPFVVMRLLSILVYNIKTYTNYFFTAKNALVLCLQVYRLWSIYHEHQHKKQKDKNIKGTERLNNMYKTAFKKKTSST